MDENFNLFLFCRGVHSNCASERYALIQACFIAVRFVLAKDRNLLSALVVQKCQDIRDADMDIPVILGEGIGRAVAAICRVLNVRQRIRLEHERDSFTEFRLRIVVIDVVVTVGSSSSET